MIDFDKLMAEIDRLCDSVRFNGNETALEALQAVKLWAMDEMPDPK